MTPIKHFIIVLAILLGVFNSNLNANDNNLINITESIVIVNAKTNLKSIIMTHQELLLFWTLKVSRWKGSQPVKLVIYDNEEYNNIFSTQILGIPWEKLEQAWNTFIYTGLRQSPMTVSTEAEMLAYIEKHPGSMGFVFKKIDQSEIIVIMVR